MDTKRKYTYQSYDYSFLNGHLTDKWSITLPRAVSAAARTIGFELTEVHPMNEPVGQLYWIDSIDVTNNAESTVTTTTYEPLHTGGWEVTFAPPTTIDGSSAASTSITYSHTDNGPKQQPIYVNNYNDFHRIYKEKYKPQRAIKTQNYWRKLNFFKKIKYGKKI